MNPPAAEGIKFEVGKEVMNTGVYRPLRPSTHTAPKESSEA